MWRLGFFFHEMGFGLLSIFLPLYIVSNVVGGSLVDIGIMSAAALLAAIPFSFFWGYVCDKTRRYKRYILLSFLASTLLLYLFTLTTSIGLLIILYVILSIFHVAHEAPKNVLIAELYSRVEWERKYAFYEGLTETGWLIGLLLGFFTSGYGFGAANTLLLCGVLNLIAFFLSLVLVADPLLVFERGLVSIEKSVDFASRGVFLASRMFDGFSSNERLRRENVTAFCGGLVLFSLATSILFTPMPVFISSITAPESLVFAIFVLNSGGAVIGYFFAGSRSNPQTGKANISRIVIFRGLFAFLLIAAIQAPLFNVPLVTTLLILLGFVYALFLVYTLSLSMELIPSGKAGLFNVLIGIGGAFGSFIGPFIAQASGFIYVFVTSGMLFLLAYVFFKMFT
jgi:MFS family permease